MVDEHFLLHIIVPSFSLTIARSSEKYAKNAKKAGYFRKYSAERDDLLRYNESVLTTEEGKRLR
jgi:hypothetical protein